MRINSISLRLGYSSSWDSRVIPGREYTRRLTEINRVVLLYVEDLFSNRVVNRSILLSSAKVKAISDRVYCLSLYVYKHRFVSPIKAGPVSLVRSTARRVFSDRLLRFLSFVITRDLAKVIPQATVKTHFILVNKKYFNAKLASDYIINKLSSKFKLKTIVPRLCRNLTSQKGKPGVIVYCSGRFDRKERASSHIFSNGKLSLSTVENEIDYYQNSVILKYGICGIKVWVAKNRTTHDI